MLFLDDRSHKNKESASCPETTKYLAHDEQRMFKWITSIKYMSSHDVLIVPLPCVIPFFPMKYNIIGSI